MQYEIIIGKIAVKLTDQVSDLVNRLIENMLNANKQAADKKPVGIRGFKEEDRGLLIKDLHEQMKKFQTKFEENKDLISDMRKNYLKEITHLRAVEDHIQF